MIRLAALGDLHGALDRLRRALDVLAGETVDAVLLTGDFASPAWERSMGRRTARLDDEVRQVVDLVHQAAGVPVLHVPGNHDLPSLDAPGGIDRRRADDDLGVRIVGLGGAGPARFGFPYEWDEDEIEALDLPPADVLLSHTPPRGCLDQIVDGRHVGSRAVERLAMSTRVVVCGHIHEARGVARQGDTLVLNAGAFGEPYGRVELSFVTLTDAGDRVEHRDLASRHHTVAEIERC